ncbi:Na+/H+ antiporter NhaC family protein [Alienimonas sp. DA493]|uniref:Na+/H+ antiporter NhaC family protein n=1 Tax=Alienimonas sp. DA493 TaxID=3373605 RepID=UPI00375519B0
MTLRTVAVLLALIGTAAFAGAAYAQEPAEAAEPAAVAEPADDGAVAAEAAEEPSPAERYGAWSLVPPLVAIGLAIAFRQVLFALLAGVYGAGLVLTDGEPLSAFRTMCTELIQPAAVDDDHVVTLLFTFFLGAMVGVMTRSGGTTALVNWVGGRAGTRQRGQLTGWGLGFLVFFDDYANMLLLGGTLKPLTDRLRISREKLAFLIDSTAAPVAGLAAVSTWVGVEIDAISEGFVALGGESISYVYFLETIPYRFYPIYLLAFVFAVAWTGRDYGPMRRAEVRAATTGQLIRPGSSPASADEVAVEDAEPKLINALAPIVVLVGLLAAVMWATGLEATAETGWWPSGDENSVRRVIENADSFTALLIASLAASLIACLTAAVTGALKVGATADAWVAGAQGMFPVAVILILAWSVGQACTVLGTGPYLAGVAEPYLSARWLPALGFLLAAAIAFSIGSSWTTMAIVIPLLIQLGAGLLGTGALGIEAVAAEPAMLGTIGAVLAGAIFGDHCSPISDTTVLSSAASGCDHLDHVATQMPYAATVGLISLVCGYVPAGFGVPSWICLPIGLVACVAVVRFVGRPIELGMTNDE